MGNKSQHYLFIYFFKNNVAIFFFIDLFIHTLLVRHFLHTVLLYFYTYRITGLVVDTRDPCLPSVTAVSSLGHFGSANIKQFMSITDTIPRRYTCAAVISSQSSSVPSSKF